MKSFKTSWVLFAVVSVLSTSVLADPPTTGARTGASDPDCTATSDSRAGSGDDGASDSTTHSSPDAGRADGSHTGTPVTPPAR